ncbi:hypothetical protein FisN_4Lh111 [Fistulifera solaris]|uniref:Uncharacterized protein n=1 Tax=Fistulifera solaris TaxID=1519565 RepID=A0A1Z5JZ54_FISSO|nr:hypothetical protein FisN_4Lh111 [Fistulifera solaris]|eukprot:GAX19310.1 hypothetical protein FisN_4Lh111 [Fistulifera solaris]
MSNIVTTAAVAYSAYQLGSWAWNQYCSASNNTKTDDWKGRRTRLRNCRMDVRRTLCRFLPTIRTIVEERIPTKEPTQALKALRADSGDSAKQDELWEVLHTRFLTRLLVTLYSYTLLSLTLTVQIHYLASRRPEKGSSEHQLALRQTYEFFFETGIVSLIRTVERAVFDCGDTDVRQCFSKQDVGAMIFSIRQQVEGTKRKRSLLRFIMSPAAYGFSDERSHLFDEMWDIMESPVMKDAESDALGFFFGKLQESGWGTAFEDDSSTKPLASIIPMFKHSVNQIFQTNEDDLEYLTAIQNLPTVLELADMSFTPDNRR